MDHPGPWALLVPWHRTACGGDGGTTTTAVAPHRGLGGGHRCREPLRRPKHRTTAVNEADGDLVIGVSWNNYNEEVGPLGRAGHRAAIGKPAAPTSPPTLALRRAAARRRENSVSRAPTPSSSSPGRHRRLPAVERPLPGHPGGRLRPPDRAGRPVRHVRQRGRGPSHGRGDLRDGAERGKTTIIKGTSRPTPTPTSGGRQVIGEAVANGEYHRR